MAGSLALYTLEFSATRDLILHIIMISPTRVIPLDPNTRAVKRVNASSNRITVYYGGFKGAPSMSTFIQLPTFQNAEFLLTQAEMIGDLEQRFRIETFRASLLAGSFARDLAVPGSRGLRLWELSRNGDDIIFRLLNNNDVFQERIRLFIAEYESGATLELVGEECTKLSENEYPSSPKALKEPTTPTMFIRVTADSLPPVAERVAHSGASAMVCSQPSAESNEGGIDEPNAASIETGCVTPVKRRRGSKTDAQHFEHSLARLLEITVCGKPNGEMGFFNAAKKWVPLRTLAEFLAGFDCSEHDELRVRCLLCNGGHAGQGPYKSLNIASDVFTLATNSRLGILVQHNDSQHSGKPISRDTSGTKQKAAGNVAAFSQFAVTAIALVQRHEAAFQKSKESKIEEDAVAPVEVPEFAVTTPYAKIIAQLEVGNARCSVSLDHVLQINLNDGGHRYHGLVDIDIALQISKYSGPINVSFVPNSVTNEWGMADLSAPLSNDDFLAKYSAASVSASLDAQACVQSELILVNLYEEPSFFLLVVSPPNHGNFFFILDPSSSQDEVRSAARRTSHIRIWNHYFQEKVGSNKVALTEIMASCPCQRPGSNSTGPATAFLVRRMLEQLSSVKTLQSIFEMSGFNPVESYLQHRLQFNDWLLQELEKPTLKRPRKVLKPDSAKEAQNVGKASGEAQACARDEVGKIDTKDSAAAGDGSKGESL